MKWRCNTRRGKLGSHRMLFGAIAMLALSGCEIRQQMYNNGRVKPLQESNFFADGRTARPLEVGTIARGQLHEDELLSTGKVDGKIADLFPYPITAEHLERGRTQYNVFCSVCHGYAGRGNGMIVQRGYKHPPSYSDERLRAAPAGHFFDTITNGWGVMPSYAAQIKVADRWAIAAYIRALQLSQNATIEDVPAEERAKIKEAQP